MLRLTTRPPLARATKTLPTSTSTLAVTATRTFATSTQVPSSLIAKTTSPREKLNQTAIRQTRTMASVPQSMKAILIKDGTGPSSSLYIDDHAVPQPGADEVLVKVKAFGLNRMDILQREGKYPLPPSAPKDIMGVEFSGHVVTSQGASQWKEGDEVFGLATGGAYAEYIKVPARMILKKPKEFSWEQAASIPEAFLTAFQALKFISNLKEGEDVLIHAGASGVGIAAIQLAKAFGAKNIYITAGSDEKIKFCEGVGATKGFNYKASNWGEELAKATDKKGVDIIMDFIGAPYYDANIQSLKRDGRLVFLAFMGGAKKEVDLAQLLFKRLHLEGTTLRSRDLEYQSSLVQGFVSSGALDRLIKGGDQLPIYKVFDWKDIKEAHDTMEKNLNTGKIVVTIP